MHHLRTVAALLLLWCGGVTSDAAAVPGELRIGPATPEGILAWEPKSFSGETAYATDPAAGRSAIRADSRGSASALMREVEIDLTATPVLHWSWKVGNLLHDVDETRKEGDDYPARVYVVFRTGVIDRRPRGISYVWSSTRPRESAWPNAYNGRVAMVAVRDAADPVGEWVEEKRNVREDIRRLFGEEVKTVRAVAIMTDTDDSGQRATAWYGDISFAAE
jgi:hypothetical protein